MRLTKVSSVHEGISIIANIGVVVSIAFLGIEMQQNTAMMQSQTRNSIVENQLSFYERGIDNSEFAEVITKLRLDENAYPTGSTERYQYSLFIISQLRMWENEFFQYQKGLFEADEFEARTNTWKVHIALTSKLNIWRTQENQFAPRFRNYLNDIINEQSL
ncbi:hypothetical protein N9J28_00225 [bacterium]|nr:hypothetical protein [bacterium]MDB4155327.1 hypothetical protein [Gammaproteobacteria bacterium]